MAERIITNYLVVEYVEQFWEGSGEQPDDWVQPEPETIITEQTPSEMIITILRVHQYSLPIFVLALMFYLWKARSKALKVGAEIDAQFAAEKEEMDAHMAAIQEKFIKKQKDQLAKAKSSEQKKDE